MATPPKVILHTHHGSHLLLLLGLSTSVVFEPWGTTLPNLNRPHRLAPAECRQAPVLCVGGTVTLMYIQGFPNNNLSRRRCQLNSAQDYEKNPE